jgi:hypothetical protein
MFTHVTICRYFKGDSNEKCSFFCGALGEGLGLQFSWIQCPFIRSGIF